MGKRYLRVLSTSLGLLPLALVLLVSGGCVSALDRDMGILKAHPNWSQRMRAAHRLGLRGSPRAVETLIHALRSDEDLFVRNAAARALGRIGDKRAVEPLVKALLDDIAVRQQAARALADIGGPEVEDRLLALARSKDALEREYAIEALALLNSDGHLTGFLQEAMADPSPTVRHQVLKALRKMSDAKGQKADPLVGFLQSPRALIRVHAAEDMGWSRNEAYVPLLEKASVEDPDERVRQAACVALGKISTQEAAEFLIGLLDHPKAPTVGVLRGLALTRRPEVVEPIIKAYGREGFPRREAVEALLEIGGARVEAFLRERLPLERGPVREVIVEALARLRDRASAQVLMASFFEDPASQLQAVRALEKIGGPEAVRFLARIAVEPETNPAARRTALRALKEMPESKEEAAEVLRRAALSRQPAVAQAARQALKFLGLSPPLEPPPMGEPEEGGLKPLPPLGQPPPQPSSRGQRP